jgi:outer membrane biosynthesis protein TonB
VVSADEGNMLVEFRVDERGRVTDLVRTDTNTEIDSAAERLLRLLRNTKFRPRFEGGQLAGSDKLVRAYDIKP